MATTYTWVEGETDTPAHKTDFFNACAAKRDDGFDYVGNPFTIGVNKWAQCFSKTTGTESPAPGGMSWSAGAAAVPATVTTNRGTSVVS